MKTSFVSFCLIALFAIGSPVKSQSLQHSWKYSYKETEDNKNGLTTDFIDGLSAGSDGSVAFVVFRNNGAGDRAESRLFWVRANDDGTSPTEPIWCSAWEQSRAPIVVAVRRNHLVYLRERELWSVTINADGSVEGTENGIIVKTFTGDISDRDLYLTLEVGARSPGYIFTFLANKDEGGNENDGGFSLSAFRFAPGPPNVSAVPTFSSVSGNSLSLSFYSEVGFHYQLQSSTSLTAESWDNVGEVAIAGNGTMLTFMQETGRGKLFFRVVAF